MATKSTAKVAAGNVSIFNESQSVCYRALLRMETVDVNIVKAHSLRIDIRYNAYRDQSHGKVERWSGSAWQEVYTLSGAELKGWESGMYVRKVGPSAADFAADLAELKARAEEVLR